MSLADVPPIPPELAAPDDDGWVEELMERAVALVSPAVDIATALEILTAPLAADESDEDSTARRWEIDGLGSAEWAMRHVAETDAELAELAHQAAEWAERIQAWFDQRAAQLGARRAFFAGHLERYALALREDDERAKTLTLPSGKVSTQGSSPKVGIADEAVVQVWAQTNIPEQLLSNVVKVETKVLLPGLRKHVKVEEIPDCAVITGTDGTIIRWDAEDGTPLPGIMDIIGEGVEALQVARVEITESHLVCVNHAHEPVPGTKVIPGGVTATVTPS